MIFYKKQPVQLHVDPNGILIDEQRIPISQIISQQVNKINPQTNKVLLQIVCKDQTFKFSFVGSDAENERTRIKDLLAVELGKQQSFTPDSSGLSKQDIEARRQLLMNDKSLINLHKELVRGGLISEQEFWKTRQDLLQNQIWIISQKKGASSASLADIKPQDTDGSDLKYTLNPEIIHSIFIQYPSVKKAYSDNVPHKLSEKDFWTLYFSSKHFHRNRSSEKDDLFTEYIKEDENDSLINPLKLNYDAENKLLDLTTTFEDRLEGNQPDSTMKAGNVKSSLPLIRKFNRHSEAILSRTQTSNPKTAQVIDEKILMETELDELKGPLPSQVKPLEIQEEKYFAAESVKATAGKVLDFNLNLDKLNWQDLNNTILPKLTMESCTGKSKITTVDNEEMLQVCQCSLELLRHYWAPGLDGMKKALIVDALSKMLITMNALEKQHVNDAMAMRNTKQAVEFVLETEK